LSESGNKKQKSLLVFSLAVLLMVAATVIIFVSREQYGLPEGSSLPEFYLKDYRAKSFDSSDLWGNVIVIVFWKGSVEASVAEIKGLDELWQKYRGNGLEAMGISLDKGEGKYLKSFITKHKVKLPLLIGNVETAHLFGGVKGVPTTYIFDRQGRVKEMWEGFRGKESIEKKILELI
jgi:peroxiredoxin